MQSGERDSHSVFLIDGYDVELLRFGMAGGAALLARNRAEISSALAAQEADLGLNPDCWPTPVEILANDENIALIGLAMHPRNAERRAFVRTNGAHPHPASASAALNNIERTIAERAMITLQELAGDKNIHDLMGFYSRKWAAKKPA